MCKYICNWSLGVLMTFVVVGCSKDDNKSVNVSTNTLEGVSYTIDGERTVRGENFITPLVENLFGTDVKSSGGNRTKSDIPTKKEFYDSLCSRIMRLESSNEGETSMQTKGFTDLIKKYNYKVVMYKYKTKNEKGEDIVLSAVFSLPYAHLWSSKLMSPKFIDIDCHYTITSNGEAPTSTDPNAFLFSVSGALVVAPDYLGFGHTVDKDQQYICEKLTATQTLDAVRAAIKILREEYNTELSSEYYSIVTGYSQGGAASASVTREIETMSEKERNIFDFRLKYAFCGGGPYDPVATIDWYFAQEGHKVQYAVAGPLILKGQISGNPDLFSSVQYEDYLTDSYKNSGIDVMYNAPKSNTTAKINSAIETKFGNRSLDNIFKPELFTQYTERSGVLATPLIESLKRNVLTDGSWFPKTPMWLFHVENDKVVPFVNFEHVKVAWGGRGVLQTSTCTVGGAETALLGDEHTTGGYRFYIQVLLNPTVNPQD